MNGNILEQFLGKVSLRFKEIKTITLKIYNGNKGRDGRLSDMKQILLIIAVVMGQSVLAADKEPLIADPKSSGAQEWEPKKTHAIIVGVLDWKNGLTPFSKRNRKDQELRDLLIKRGTPAENVTMLLDQEATLPKIREAVAHTLSKTSKDSTLIIYYDGHG